MSSLEIMWYKEKVQETNASNISDVKRGRRLKVTKIRRSLAQSMRRL